MDHSGHLQLEERRKQHNYMLLVMYRQAQLEFNLNDYRPMVNLKNRNKIEFKVPYTNLTKLQNSPFYRGVRIWDRVTFQVQRVTIKVISSRG